jgi:hypothetical protein
MFNFRMHQASVLSDTLAREISERSVAATLSCLGVVADKMSPAELRGYVRAHAMPFVYDEAIQLVGRELPIADLNSLVASAVEQTSHLVARQLKAHPIVAVPTPHIRLRIAA